MLIKRILLQNQPHSCYISHFHTSKLDSFRKIRLGHHPKLPFHTCNTQQEIVCLRYTLTTGNTLVLARDGTRVVQRLPPFPCSSPDRFSRPAPKDLALGILNYCVGFRLFFLSVLRFKFSSFFFRFWTWAPLWDFLLSTLVDLFIHVQLSKDSSHLPFFTFHLTDCLVTASQAFRAFHCVTCFLVFGFLVQDI